MVGKFGAIFPMIGKNFRRFSNDWKKISGPPGGPGSVRAVSTGFFKAMPGTPRLHGRGKARPSQDGHIVSCPSLALPHCGRAEARPSPWRAHWEGRASAQPCGGKTSGKPQKNLNRSGGAGVPPAGCMEMEHRPKLSMLPPLPSHPAARLEAAPPEVVRCLFRRSCATSGGAASCRAICPSPWRG